VNHYQVWQTTSSAFDQTKSLQSTFGGLNHSAIGTNKMVAFNNSGWGGSSGVFIGVYDAGNTQGNNGSGTGYAPPFSVYLKPLASQGTAQTVPPGCYVTTSSEQNPDCNISEILDSHLSWVGDPGTDKYPACGTSFNYATLGPAFNMAEYGNVLPDVSNLSYGLRAAGILRAAIGQRRKRVAIHAHLRNRYECFILNPIPD
jgi:hypothetical protein